MWFGVVWRGFGVFQWTVLKIADLVLLLNIIRAKQSGGRRPRMQSTPIDNAYVQVNNFLFT